MSDFLSQLLERATGQAPVLEYRRASLFEPLTKTMPFDDLQPDTALVETETEVLNSKDQKTSQGRKIEFSERSKPVPEVVSETEGTIAQEERTPDKKTLTFSKTKPKPEQAVEQLSTIVDRAKPSTTEDADPASSSRETQKDAVKEAMNVPARVVGTRLEREIVIVADHENRDAAVNETTRQPEVPQPPVQLIKPKVRLMQTENAAQPKRQTDTNEKMDFIRSPAKTSSIKPAELPHPIPGSFIKPPRRSSNSQAHLPPPAPTVQVTIGRVEVRATPAPLVKQSPPRVAPKLTLEDYLRGRNGERA